MSDHGVGHALVANERRQRARVDAVKPDDPARGEPIGEMPLRAVIGGVGDGRGENGADRAGAPGQIDRLYVFVVGADIADMRKGEGDDLRGVGRIGENFLIAGHGRVETDLAHRLAPRADAERLDDFARGQHQHAGRRGVVQPVAFS